MTGIQRLQLFAIQQKLEERANQNRGWSTVEDVKEIVFPEPDPNKEIVIIDFSDSQLY